MDTIIPIFVIALLCWSLRSIYSQTDPLVDIADDRQFLGWAFAFTLASTCMAFAWITCSLLGAQVHPWDMGTLVGVVMANVFRLLAAKTQPADETKKYGYVLAGLWALLVLVGKFR